MSFIDDTKKHISEVQNTMIKFANEITRRGKWHDYSKFSDEEGPIFKEVLDGKQTAKYGTPEYDEVKRKLGPALEHHYRENSHHPEHYSNGVEGMSLIDLLEMVADWKSATKRHKDDSMEASLEINCRRYNIDRQLKSILLNTIKELNNE